MLLLEASLRWYRRGHTPCDAIESPILLDFTDGIRALNHVPVSGQRAPFHDILEDQFGDIPGFALFALGALKEITRKDETPAAS